MTKIANLASGAFSASVMIFVLYLFFVNYANVVDRYINLVLILALFFFSILNIGIGISDNERHV